MLNNAIKFCDHIVEVSLVSIQKEDNSIVRIRVNNDGERIPKDVTTDIFKPFSSILEKMQEYRQKVPD